MYLTIPRKESQTIKLSFEDILLGTYDNKNVYTSPIKSATITRIVDDVPEKYQCCHTTNELVEALTKFNIMFEELRGRDRTQLYKSFSIPKKSGGFRHIDAPVTELKNAHYVLKNILETMFQASHHTAAYAYIKERAPKDAVRRHQENESNWFLKTDFSDFFGSITPEFTMRMLRMIYPFNLVCQSEQGKKELAKALDLCFLRGGLPQGTPMSPMLTNLIMIPIDHRIAQVLSKTGFVYTRYADDMLISSQKTFVPERMVAVIKAVLEEFRAPFSIKPEKTRYGSRKGSNWNLGLMLNAENEITVGHMKKKYFKAAVCNFITDHLNAVEWPMEDAMQLAGQLSYYRSVEKDYFDMIIRKADMKFHVDFMQMLKEAIQGVSVIDL